MKYRICPYCGANLDPQEKCECEEQENSKQIRIDRYIQQNFEKTHTGQLMIIGVDIHGK